MFKSKPKTRTFSIKLELLEEDAAFLDKLCSDKGPLERPIDLDESIHAYVLKSLRKARSEIERRRQASDTDKRIPQKLGAHSTPMALNAASTGSE